MAKVPVRLQLRNRSSDWVKLREEIKKMKPRQQISVLTPQFEDANSLHERVLAFEAWAGMELSVEQAGRKLTISRKSSERRESR